MRKSPINGVKSLFDADRGVSPVIAVALLILIAIGFAVAIQGVGTDIVDSVQQPPEAAIDGNPDDDEIRLTIESVTNADELRIQQDNEEVEKWEADDGNLSAGTTTKVGLTDDDDSPYDQITVVAVSLPDDERIVYTYEVPDSVGDD